MKLVSKAIDIKNRDNFIQDTFRDKVTDAKINCRSKHMLINESRMRFRQLRFRSTQNLKRVSNEAWTLCMQSYSNKCAFKMNTWDILKLSCILFDHAHYTPRPFMFKKCFPVHTLCFSRIHYFDDGKQDKDMPCFVWCQYKRRQL